MGLKLQTLIQTCRSLNLNFVGTRGNVSSSVVVVGEAPGAEEDENKDKFGNPDPKPFVGSSGREQDRMLTDAGFCLSPNPLSEVWFVNPYSCRPPNNDIDRLEELGIPKQVYLDAFWELLNETRPTILIPVGATPTGILCPETIEKSGKYRGKVIISKWRGSLLTSPHLPWPHYVVPNIHPAFVLRTWSERQVAVLCYAKANEELKYWKEKGSLNPLPKRDIIVDPMWETLRSYLYECLDSKNPICADIEMLRRKVPTLSKPKGEWNGLVYVLGLATSSKRGLAFCLWNYAENGVELFRLLQRIFAEKRLIVQNGLTFDSHWLETISLYVNPLQVDDTLVRHHVLWPELEHSLQWMTIQYTRQPYYKDEGKLINFKNDVDKRRQMWYCGLDVTTTYEVFEEQELEFKERMVA